VTFLNPGTSGRFWLQVPNALKGRAQVHGPGNYWIPGPELLPWKGDYWEGGPPGEEHLVVIVSESPVIEDSTLARSTTDEPFVELTDEELDRLRERLKELDPSTWSAGVRSFWVLELGAPQS
jgi:hypothetical protein